MLILCEDLGADVESDKMYLEEANKLIISKMFALRIPKIKEVWEYFHGSKSNNRSKKELRWGDFDLYAHKIKGSIKFENYSAFDECRSFYLSFWPESKHLDIHLSQKENYILDMYYTDNQDVRVYFLLGHVEKIVRCLQTIEFCYDYIKEQNQMVGE